jgi:hypothetical protein
LLSGFAMPFTGIHDEDMKDNAALMKELEAIVVDLERAHRHAEYMRRDMVERLKDVAESRDFWDREAADKLVQLERYKSVLEMWRKGIPVFIPSGDDDRIKVCTVCGREGLVGRCCGRDTWNYKNDDPPMMLRCKRCDGHGTVSDDLWEDPCGECDGDGYV